ncbi:hypothetical protein ACHGLA_25940 [Streptomyces sp. YH02]|uniref:hypothetical protein n=1 Tax=Streptomyces sp. YH02 TaxID=3256999 RepID=UPI003757AAB2
MRLRSNDNEHGWAILEGIAHPQVDQVGHFMIEPGVTLFFTDGLAYFFMQNTSSWQVIR